MIQSSFKKYTLEADVDDYVKVVLSALGLKKGVDYNEKSAMSDYMKEALKVAAKTKSKKLFGIPDFHLESRKIPVVIENKLGNKYHISANKSGIKMDENSIRELNAVLKKLTTLLKGIRIFTYFIGLDLMP